LEETLGVPVLQSYGMSEAGILAADPAPTFKRKTGTVGLISRDELTIVGPKGGPFSYYGPYLRAMSALKVGAA
jgi:hypothetical protein